mgnify:CR=1 FL=1
MPKRRILGLALLALAALLTIWVHMNTRTWPAPWAVPDVPPQAQETLIAALDSEGYRVESTLVWAGTAVTWHAPARYRVFYVAGDEGRELYMAEVRVDAQGNVTALESIHQLTDTPDGDETPPVAAASWLAYGTRVMDLHQTITCIPLAEPERREIFALAQPTADIFLSWQTGDSDLSLRVVAPRAATPLDVVINPATRALTPDDGALFHMPSARGEMPFLPNLVSRIRELPGVGPEKIAFLENVFFTIVDRVNLLLHRPAPPTSEMDPPTPSPQPIASATVTPLPLPDLLIVYGRIELESGGGCGDADAPLGVRIGVRNAGAVHAGPFLVEVNGVSQTVTDGLAAGAEITLWFSGYVAGGEQRAAVDAGQQVTESDETNNTLVQMLPIPTPLPTCTATPTGTRAFTLTPTPSLTYTPPPSPSATPTATATPAGETVALGITRHARIKPDPRRPYAEAEVIEIDPTLLAIHMVAGTMEPHSTTGLVGPGVIPQEAWPALVASFNGGFAAMHGQYGMMVDRKVYLPARDGLATLAVYEDGSIQMGTWGKHLQRTPDMVSYRQNCPPLIENGVITAETGKLALWGLSVSDEVYLLRSGIGITADGRLLYVAGRSLSAYTLARALQMAGAEYAMQLDIDEYHVVFITYDVQQGEPGAPPKVMGRKLRDDWRGYDSYFLRPFQLDFFYLTRRAEPLAQAVRLSTLATPATPAPVATPSVSLPGRIAFASTRDGNWELYMMPAAQPDQVQRLTDDPADDLFPAWSPDGSQIAFASRRGGDLDIYILYLAGGEVRQVTDQPSEEWAPAWSPDGTQLAYQSDRNGQSDIYICVADGSGERRLTTMIGNHEGPSWSPDGRTIIFDSDLDLAGTVSNAISIYRIGASGGEPQRLFTPGEFPRWSPDGSAVAFMIRSGAWQIFVRQVDGSGYWQVTKGSDDARYPAWSPDGRWLAFAAYRNGQWELNAIPSTGGEPIRLSFGVGDSAYPTWGP